MLVFEIARQGDTQALEVHPLGWPRAGNDGRPVLLTNSIFMLKHLIRQFIRRSSNDDRKHDLPRSSFVRTGARLVRLTVPPVVGEVVLGMQVAGLDTRPVRMPKSHRNNWQINEIQE